MEGFFICFISKDFSYGVSQSKETVE